MVDRYFPDADAETRERAREAFVKMAGLLYRIGDRILAERAAAERSPEPAKGAIMEVAPGEPHV